MCQQLQQKKDVILPKGTLFISIFPPFQINKIYCYSFYEMCIWIYSLSFYILPLFFFYLHPLSLVTFHTPERLLLNGSLFSSSELFSPHVIFKNESNTFSCTLQVVVCGLSFLHSLFSENVPCLHTCDDETQKNTVQPSNTKPG